MEPPYPEALYLCSSVAGVQRCSTAIAVVSRLWANGKHVADHRGNKRMLDWLGLIQQGSAYTLGRWFVALLALVVHWKCQDSRARLEVPPSTESPRSTWHLSGVIENGLGIPSRFFALVLHILRNMEICHGGKKGFRTEKCHL